MGKRKRADSDDDDDYKFDEDVEEMDEEEGLFVDKESEQMIIEDDESEVDEPPKKKAKTSTTTSKKTSTKKETKKSTSTKKAAASTTKGATKAKAKKTDNTIKSESEAKEYVLEFLQKTNRPFSTQGIVDNSGGKLKKTMAQKCVDALVKKGKVVEKLNKKAKVYYINQADLPVLSKEELAALDEKIKKLTKKKSEIMAEINTLSKTKSELQKTMTDEEILQSITQLEEEVSRKRARLQNLTQEGAVLAEPGEKTKALQAMDKYAKAWRQRKSIFKGILDKLSDASEDLKPSAIIEELGLETDEEVGVSLDTLGKLE